MLKDTGIFPVTGIKVIPVGRIFVRMNRKTMNIVVWVLQIALAVFFFMPGYTKLFTPVAELVSKGMLKPGESPVMMRGIGVLELLGSLGMILPMALRIAPRLTAWAAVGFCLVMVGAMFVHGSMKDYKTIPMLVGVFLVSAFVAWYRFKTTGRDAAGAQRVLATR